MSNAKRIDIQGELPFNCGDHFEFRQFLGQMNCPTIGINIEWLGVAGQRPNEHGGKTQIHAFQIQGIEAVSNGWIEKLLLAIVKAGGEINHIFLQDTDNRTAIHIDIPNPIEDRIEFICPVMFTVQDGEVELHQVRQWLEQAVYVDLQTEDCGNVDGNEESDATVSMGVMLEQLDHA